MSQLYSTGPVSVFVGLYGQTPQFLGYGERAPEIDIIPSFVPFFSDSGGPEVPAELLLAGQSGRVTVDLNKMNMKTLRVIQTRGRGRNFTATDPGLDDAGQIGTPMLTNNCSCKLYLRFDRSGVATYNNFLSGAIPRGYRFFAAILDPETVLPSSTTALKQCLAWKCLRAWDPTIKTPFGRGTRRLFDNDLTDLMGINPD